MAKKKRRVKIEPKFTVIVLECPHCGEQTYYIKSCHHCGADGAMRFKEHLHLTKTELQTLSDQNIGEVYGDVTTVLREDNINEGTNDITPLSKDELENDDGGDFSLDDL